MGREFDRHHLPRWRPEPPFLPGRIAEPVEAPGARSGLPILQQSQAGAEQREVQGTAGGSRGWAAQEPALEQCGAARRRPGHRPQVGCQGRALPPRRRHQDLEPDAAGAPAPARGVRPAARRLPRPSTNAAGAPAAKHGPDRDDPPPGTAVAHAILCGVHRSRRSDEGARCLVVHTHSRTDWLRGCGERAAPVGPQDGSRPPLGGASSAVQGLTVLPGAAG